ncbi:glycosyltransferase family 2 protein [Ekhidna sp.]
MEVIKKLFSRFKKKQYLSIVAIFKNEAHIIDEWIAHYINEGVDHFYLIDNGSNDSYLEKIQSYLDQGIISLIIDDEKWAQVKLYNQYVLPLKHRSEWLIVCDLDEFIYARNGYNTIREYLESRPNSIAMVRVPWKMFGSNGNKKQPVSVIDSFTKRCEYINEVEHPGMRGHSYSSSKVIVRNRFLNYINIHQCDLRKWPKGVVENSKGEAMTMEDPNHQYIDEGLLKESFLHLNHYAIQSFDWFMKVKMTRGAADTERHEQIRDKDYFLKYDLTTNQIEDSELSLKTNNACQKDDNANDRRA